MVSGPKSTVFRFTDILKSRKVWAAFLLLVVSVIGSQIPGFQMNTERGAAMAAILASYILGVAIDPGPNAGNWRGMVQSRKFWAALIGLAIVFLDAFKTALPWGLTQEQLISLAVALSTYIAGVGVEGLVRRLPGNQAQG